MKFGTKGDDRNTVSTQLMKKKRKYAKRRRSPTITGTLPALPFDLVAEIFCRLPVKLLLQLQCLGKLWKSLISDPKFTKKHLQFSKVFQHNHHLIAYTTGVIDKLILKDSTIPSIFKAAMSTSRIRLTKLWPPDILDRESINLMRVCSCDGILCLTHEGYFFGHSAVLWNPSIRRFNMLPALGNPGKKVRGSTKYSFGYDYFTHTYKIVAVSFFYDKSYEVLVYTLGTDSWRRIQDLPYYGYISEPGVFARGTINWLAHESSSSHNIVSLDLEKESYQKLLKPNLETNSWTLRALMDRLYIIASFKTFVDIWIMKDYDNEEPWNKLYRVPYMQVHGLYPNDGPLYITEDDQVLIYYKHWEELMVTVYDSKSGTFNMSARQKINGFYSPAVYVESLISPCS
ncbi:putative F-box domain-containing protein [Medicago truncatula]|uniref:F-box protein interaction domain protein n=1 Tax=Medicago truncatula TaxID=3880 RepID=A0A072UUS3_MEDTR|nr:F-box/kelch-repeat protein At3g23880 [Medicago truncatula]KEH32808.1 F-box protein interaction domain protein [Medicago truncatula]RHN65277.1 putative F-box domain-containing protein [Medicago truncatula]